MNVQRTVLGLVAAAVSLSLAGCPSNEKKDESNNQPPVTAAPAPTPAPTAAATAAQTVAAATPTPAAQTPLPAPPAEKVETEGKPPSAHHTWVHGYWHWDGHEYQWHPGYWEDTTVFATTPPPPPRVEMPGLPPGPNYIYLPGYWHWGGKEYLWAPGHWSVKREGFVYVHPTYVEEKGHWVRAGFGWQKEDDAWKKRYTPTEWEKHGDVWVRKAESAEWVKRGEKEGWYRRH